MEPATRTTTTVHGRGLRLQAWFRRWPPALRRRVLLVAAMVAALALLAMAFRQPLSDRLWPETRAQALHAAAEEALARGRLSAPDGSGARELFAAALALDPDRDASHAGLQRVGLAALARARTALEGQRFEQAHRDLALARELAVPRRDVDSVADALRRREAAVAGIDQLLARAARARRDGRLDGAPDAALPLYQRVLALQPARVEALEGREDAIADLLQDARARLDAGDLATGARLVAQGRHFDAGHVDLPDTQGALVRAADARRAAAAAALRRNRLEAALAGYREVLAAVPEDAQALAGIEDVAAAHARRAERLAADFRFDGATRALADARALSPHHPALARAERRLRQAQQSQARVQAPRLGPQRTRRLQQLLAAAAAAEARGDLLGPPGESAFDHLRAARALAPDAIAVRRAQARLAPAARTCFDRELRGNNLARAQACLDARVQLEGEGAAVRDARRRLAQRWLAVGDERLGAGELAAARRAHAAARGLDPRTPGLDAFGARIDAAAAAREE
jgi:hypothetical protein